jgi:hypothetical protein
MRKNLTFLLACCWAILLSAQTNNSYYTIHLGTFSNNTTDFKPLGKVGYLFAKEKPAQGVYDVYMGGYDAPFEAALALNQVQKMGFSAAKIQQYQVKDNLSVASIQITTLSNGNTPNWTRLQQAGDLFVIPNQQGAKVLAGIYPNIEEAKKHLAKIQALGFTDAFVRTAHPTFLDKVSNFELGEPVKEIGATVKIGPKPSNVTLGTHPQHKEPSFIPVDYNLDNSTPIASTTPGVPTYPTPNPGTYTSVPSNQPPPQNSYPSQGGFRWDQTQGNQPQANYPPQTQPRGVPNNPSLNTNPAPNTNPVPSEYSYQARGGTQPNPNANPQANNNKPNPSLAYAHVQRQSVQDLQLALQAEQAYRASADGYYNLATEQAFDYYKTNNRVMQRYSLWSQQNKGGSSSENLSNVLNRLDRAPNASATLATYQHPLAKAYQAYELFRSKGAGFEVNNLMNGAIREVYNTNPNANQIGLDGRSTYAYANLRQVLLHLFCLHAAYGSEYPLPCWLQDRHPNESAEAQAQFNNVSNMALPSQPCEETKEWESVQILKTIAQDIGVQDPSPALMTQAFNQRNKLYQGITPPDANEQAQLENWSQDLFTRLDTWAQQDLMHQDLVKSFKIVFQRSTIDLEEYFLGKGNNPAQARSLALATLHTMVDPHLQRI